MATHILILAHSVFQWLFANSNSCGLHRKHYYHSSREMYFTLDSFGAENAHLDAIFYGFDLSNILYYEHRDMDSDEITNVAWLYILEMINTTSSMEDVLHHHYIFCVQSH